MRWQTIWFTVVVAASAAHLTIDNSLQVTNAINVDVDLPSPVTSTQLQLNEVTQQTTTEETTEYETSTIAAVTTIGTTISEQMTDATEETDPGSGAIVSYPPTSATSSPYPNSQQMGRSSEVVGEVLPDGGDSGQEYLVLTGKGLVQGFPWHTNADIIAYIDIPYASFSSPFQDPVNANAWDNIHQVREHDKRCPQLKDNAYVGDLDCLTLSIFAPVEAINASVLFHIHESNFVSGSGDPAIYGPDYFVSRGVILVLPNYRLGALGFLCLGNATAPGNAGLKDLTFALKWVSENIRAFGGDPGNVVVSGDGTSGALVGYLSLASASNGYFTKAITESGAVLSHWALNRNPMITAEALIRRMRQISTANNTFAAADVRIIVLASVDIPFSPCIEHTDDTFLSSTPWGVLQDALINITFMIGSASHAGAIEAAKINEVLIEQMNNNFESFLPSDLHFEDDDSRILVGNRVKRLYFGNETITLAHMEEMALCYTDSCYLGPAVRTARALVEAGARVFFYEFGFVGEMNRELDSINRPLNATVRGDIVGYLFSQDGVTPAEGSVERAIVDLMMDLWISFIDDGCPTSENVTWTELNSTSVADESWLYIGEETRLKCGLHVDRMALWSDIYAEHFTEHNAGFRHLPGLLGLAVWLVKASGRLG